MNSLKLIKTEKMVHHGEPKKLVLFVLIVLLAGCGQSTTPATEPLPTASTSPPLVIADFDSCDGTNDLDHPMGAAYNAPNSLQETYVQEPGRGCVVQLSYSVKDWAAYWIKLMGTDLTPYQQLIFDIRSDTHVGRMKIEVKNQDNEVSILYIDKIGTDWETRQVSLANFTAGYGPPLSSFQNIGEIVFVFEATQSGPTGIVYLDNIRFQ